MLKFLYAGLALGWLASMIYEGAWDGDVTQYVALGAIGATVFGGLFIRNCMRDEPAGRRTPAMLWFLLAAAVCAAFFKLGLEQAVQADPPHVRALPMYVVMFLDFLGMGCYTWWRKRRR